MFNYTHKCIMKTFNGIMMVALTAMFSVFCGCSQDEDDYNNSDMYTLAEEMGTRGGGGDPGGTSGKKRILFTNIADVIHKPKRNLGESDATLLGEYDTTNLTISISNYEGDAIISILTVESGYLMSSDTIAVPEESPVNFLLSSYPTNAYYQIFVTLGSDTYYGVFDL